MLYRSPNPVRTRFWLAQGAGSVKTISVSVTSLSSNDVGRNIHHSGGIPATGTHSKPFEQTQMAAFLG
jgi:hypothetical protein